MPLQFISGLFRHLAGDKPSAQDVSPAKNLDHTQITLELDNLTVPLVVVKNQRARRYILRLRPDGVPRVTVPRGGSIEEALRFARRQSAWISRQMRRWREQPDPRPDWHPGDSIFYQGVWTPLTVIPAQGCSVVELGDQRLRVPEGSTDLRPEVEKRLWKVARARLVPRVWELDKHCQQSGLDTRRPLRKVTVRNQRSRWGSCSARGTISLNWRLIQTPDWVRDYLILHELVHLREMNHSSRFWRQVSLVCPNFPDAEAWIKKHARILR